MSSIESKPKQVEGENRGRIGEKGNRGLLESKSLEYRVERSERNRFDEVPIYPTTECFTFIVRRRETSESEYLGSMVECWNLDGNG